MSTGLLLLLHVVCVVLVYVLARERVEPQLALGVAAVVLFLGAAWNDLLVPFQISFLLSVAAGLGMLIALERRDLLGTITVAVLLAVSLASSSVGIAFGAAAGVHVLVRDDRLRRLWAVAVPGLLYLVWLMAYGDPTATSGGRTLTTLAKDNLPAAPGYVATAAAGAWGAITGLGADWGRPLALASFVVLAVFIVRTRRDDAAAPSRSSAAAAAYWGLAAVFRAHVNPPTDSRYLYLGAILVLLIALELLPPVVTTPSSPRGRRPGRCIRDRQLRLTPERVAVSPGLVAVRPGRARRALESRAPGRGATSLPIRSGRRTSRLASISPRFATTARLRARRQRSRAPARPSGRRPTPSCSKRLARPLCPMASHRASRRRSNWPQTDKRRRRAGAFASPPSAAGAALDVGVPPLGLVVESGGPVELRLRGFADGYAQQPFASIPPGTSALRLPARRGVQWHARLSGSEPFRVCSAGVS